MESAGSSGAVSGGRLRKSRRPSCPRRPVRLWYPLHPLIHSRTYPVNHRQNEIAPRTGYRVPAGFLNNYEKISSTACLLNRSPIKRKLDLAMIAEEPNEAEKEKNDKNERQKTPPSDVPPRMDKYDRLNSSSTLKQCFFPWPKQLDQVSLLKPVSFVFVHVDENVATAIMRIGPECEKGTVFG
ncbi:uncharacterized protein LOC134846091 [Symsagittifera roscoffensis]|uniref:uncharacterized protein LOC134846091 n=1 Tax=Symsagittifera roscoffensis TaxID=84072 RepID=UPI00307BE2FD